MHVHTPWQMTPTDDDKKNTHIVGTVGSQMLACVSQLVCLDASKKKCVDTVSCLFVLHN